MRVAIDRARIGLRMRLREEKLGCTHRSETEQKIPARQCIHRG